jgi:biotin synthase
VPGTPLAGAAPVDPLDFVRTIAAARLMMPRSHVRLSAGRQGMSDELQTLCFLAGANSIFYGEKLLTTGNPDVERDRSLLARLGIRPETMPASPNGFLGNNVEPPPSAAEGRRPPCARDEETAA